MEAVYIGSTEYYAKHYMYRPMIIKHGKTYDIIIDDALDMLNRWVWVSIIENGCVRTQIPYQKHLVKEYWKFKGQF